MTNKKEFTITLDVAVKAIDKEIAIRNLSVMLSRRGFKFRLGEVKEKAPEKEPNKPKEVKKEVKTEKDKIPPKATKFEGKYSSK